MAEKRTDHGADINQMRLVIKQLRLQLASSQTNPADLAPLQREVVILKAAADLLECHDDTGISLDSWPGPRALVELAFEIISPFGSATIQPNNA